MSQAGTGTGPNLLHTSLVVHGMLVQVVDTVLYRFKASSCRYQGPGSWILLCCVEGAIFADFSVFGKTHGYHFSNREMEILFFSFIPGNLCTGFRCDRTSGNPLFRFVSLQRPTLSLKNPETPNNRIDRF